MTDQTPAQNPQEPEQVKVDAQPAQTPSAPQPDPAPQAKQGSGVDDLPSWAQEMIAGLRKENGDRRTKAKTVEDQVATQRADIESLRRELALEKVVNANKVPAELVARIQGDTPEAMDADAKALMALFKPPAPSAGGTEPSGGLNPGQPGGGSVNAAQTADAIYSAHR